MQVSEDLFQHPFCPSVRIGTGSFRAFFSDRDKCRISVYSCRRTEDNIFNSVISHGVTQIQSSCNIIFIILDWFYYRFSYRFQSSKMNNCVYLLFVENIVHGFFITNIRIIKYYFFSCDFFYSLQSFLTGIVQIVHNNNVITCIQQFYACMASDITSTTCN